MKKFFAEFFNDPVYHALITVIVGILVVVFHKLILDIACMVLGAILALIGIINIIKYFRLQGEAKYNLLSGLIFGALGVSIIFSPDTLEGLAAVAVGILILYHGIVNLENSIKLKKSGYKFWYIALIFALLTVGAGITLIVLKNASALPLAAGIVLIVEGVLNTWVAIKVKKANG